MKDAATIFASCIAIAACGGSSASLPPAVRALADDPHFTVTYEVTPDYVTCSNRPSPMAASDYPNGWWCHWRCSEIDGAPRQVWLALHEDASGHWLPAAEVYTGRCYDEGVTCPTCNFE